MPENARLIAREVYIETFQITDIIIIIIIIIIIQNKNKV
jgi:hypothetical protein